MGNIKDDVIRACMEKFEFYADQHRAKNTPDADAKAVVNVEMALMCDDALKLPTFADLAMRTAAPAGTFHIPEDATDRASLSAELDAALMSYIDAARELDRLKSRLIYGKEKDESKFDPLPSWKSLMDVNNLIGKDQLVHAILGIASEGGELAEHLLWTLHARVPDVAGISEETGDIDWFQELLAAEIDVTVEHSREDVITKLRKRYPEKYTQDLAVARLDKAE